MLNVVNGDNIQFVNNRFLQRHAPGQQRKRGSIIDLETNTAQDFLTNILVKGNIMDNRYVNRPLVGYTVSAVDTSTEIVTTNSHLDVLGR
jgi:hypothetical protein